MRAQNAENGGRRVFKQNNKKSIFLLHKQSWSHHHQLDKEEKRAAGLLR